MPGTRKCVSGSSASLVSTDRKVSTRCWYSRSISFKRTRYSSAARAARMHGAHAQWSNVSRVASEGLTLAGCGSAAGFEDIARAANGVDQLAGKRIVELAPQAPDRHVHDIRVAVEVDVPDLLGDERARQHLALVAYEQAQ